MRKRCCEHNVPVIGLLAPMLGYDYTDLNREDNCHKYQYGGEMEVFLCSERLVERALQGQEEGEGLLQKFHVCYIIMYN